MEVKDCLAHHPITTLATQQLSGCDPLSPRTLKNFTTTNMFDLLSDGTDGDEFESTAPARCTASKPALALGSAHSHKDSRRGATVAGVTLCCNKRYVYDPNSPATCARCGDIGHLVTACKADYCSICGKHGHKTGRCASACQTCGSIHKQTQHQHGRQAVPCPLLKCHECGLYGHKAWECPKVKCRRCGLYGHYANSCTSTSRNSSSNASKTDHSSNSITPPSTAASCKAPADTAAAGGGGGCPNPHYIRLLRDLDALQAQQQRQHLIASLRSCVPDYVDQLKHNDAKLDVLSRLQAADLAAISQQSNCTAILDKVYYLHLQSRACNILPSQLGNRAAAGFQTAVQQAFPGLLLPADWSSSSSWRYIDQVVMRCGAVLWSEDKRKLLNQLKLEAQMATYQGNTGATQKLVGGPPGSSRALAPGQVAPAVRFVKRPLPLQQQDCSPQLVPSAGLQQNPRQDQHEQQRLDSRPWVTGPSPASATPQQQEQQLIGVKATNNGDTPVHPVTETSAAALSTENSLPLLVATMCDHMRSMLQMVTSKEVQLTQPFLDQLLLAAEAVNEADHLCKQQQKVQLQHFVCSVKEQQSALEPGQQGKWHTPDWDSGATQQQQRVCEASQTSDATAAVKALNGQHVRLRMQNSVTGPAGDFENAVAALSAAAAAAVPDDVGGEDDELLGLLLNNTNHMLC